MELTGEIDTRQFNAQLNALSDALIGKGKMGDAATVLQDGARLLIKQIMNFTPPTKHGAKNPKTQGEVAIRKDLMGGRNIGPHAKSQGIFFAIKPWMPQDEHDQTVRLFSKKNGDTFGVEKELYRPQASMAVMSAHHKKHRSRRTGRVTTAGSKDRQIGRWKFIDRMAVEEKTLAKYVLSQQKKVGYMRAGWMKAADSVNLKVRSPWIKRHRFTRQGVGDSRLVNTKQPYVIIGNRTQGIDRIRGQVQSALRARTEAMGRRIKLILSGYSKDVARGIRPRKRAKPNQANASV